MTPSRHVRVRVDLTKVRDNAAGIRARVGVPVIAVVKADAYGLGAAVVARAVADLVAGFYVFDVREAVDARLDELPGETIAVHGESTDPAAYVERHIRPGVWTTDRAAALRVARPVLSVDTGQQRFACPAERVDDVLRAGEITEAFTHATGAEQVEPFARATDGKGLRRHAAGTSLLDDPRARFDAVRPGLALYDGAARVSARLVDARDSRGPAGYTGFRTPRHGLILCGYANGLRVGPCRVNGHPRRILEVGMQSSFVEIGPGDETGDEVVLLGDGLTLPTIASEWKSSPQEALVRLCGCGVREHAGA